MRTRRRRTPTTPPVVMRVKRKPLPLVFTDGEVDPSNFDFHGSRYRGDSRIQFRFVRGQCECAVQCAKCERWWGWYPERAAQGIRAEMDKQGCTRCRS